DGLEHVPVVDYAGDGLLVGQRGGLADVVTDHRLTHQLLGEREVALVPDDQVVLLDHLAGSPGHANTSMASMSSAVATARAVSSRHSARERSGNVSQPISVMTGSTIR